MKLNWAERLLVNSPVRVMMQRRLIRWLQKIADLQPCATVLEVGCGRGAGACLILEAFRPARLYALDLDHRMIRDAAGYLSPSQKETIALLVGDGEHLPHRDEALDAVFGFGVLHHLPQWREGLGEIARVLKAGGVYFLEEFYPPIYQNFLAKRLFLHPECDRFDSRDLHLALKEAGFTLKGFREWRMVGIMGVAVKESPPGGAAAGQRRLPRGRPAGPAAPAPGER